MSSCFGISCWLCCWQEACLTDVTAALRRYCWGNESTPMGKKRAVDGHPAQYQLKYIELGCAFPLSSLAMRLFVLPLLWALLSADKTSSCGF